MGGKRKKQAQRCGRCRMLELLCICRELPSLRTRTRIVLLRHRTERWKTTNTGGPAASCLRDAQLVEYAGRGVPLDPTPDFGPREDCFLLFPRRDAEPLPASVLAAHPRPPTVVVLDGTWAQTRKMAQHVPFVRTLPCLALPERARPRGGLREEVWERGMATIDAVAWLLEAAGEPEAGRELARVHRLMLERTMASRGTPLPGGPTIRELEEAARERS